MRKYSSRFLAELEPKRPNFFRRWLLAIGAALDSVLSNHKA